MNISRLFRKNQSVTGAALLFYIIAFMVYYFTRPATPNPFNYFVYLADAFLHGRLHVTNTPFYFEELVTLNGKQYVIYPPLPAILMIPFVAVWGLGSSQVMVSVMAGALNVSIFYLLMARLTPRNDIRIWVTAMFAFGSIHWYTSTIGSVWYVAHMFSLSFLLLAIYETVGLKRPLLVGLLLGASYWCRVTTILSVGFFLIMLSDKWLAAPGGSFFKRIRLMPLLCFVLGVLVFVFLNSLYNFLRFGSPFDVAYSLHTISDAKAQVSPWFDQGLLSLTYIKHHLYAFLVEPPAIRADWPYVVPSMTGLSVFITTPAFIFIFLARPRDRLTLACWAGIIPVALLIFTKSGTGWTQFGYRYALDFYAFLFLLAFGAMRDCFRWYHKLLIALGIAVNLWGVLFINKFGWYVLY